MVCLSFSHLCILADLLYSSIESLLLKHVLEMYCFSLTREDIDDDEVVEDIANDIDERECSMGLEESSTASVTGSTTTTSSILPDSGLIAEQKLLAYNDVTWRLRVRLCIN